MGLQRCSLMIGNRWPWSFCELRSLFSMYSSNLFLVGLDQNRLSKDDCELNKLDIILQFQHKYHCSKHTKCSTSIKAPKHDGGSRNRKKRPRGGQQAGGSVTNRIHRLVFTQQGCRKISSYIHICILLYIFVYIHVWLSVSSYLWSINEFLWWVLSC